VTGVQTCALPIFEEFQNERMSIMNKIVQSDSYAAAVQDNQLKKKSNDLMYYVWLTLAIAILFVAIRKIK
jgi:folylpolyglutamate synthase/dihydropteroate synthase